MIQNNQIHNDHLSLGAPIPPTDTTGTSTVGVAEVGEKEPPLRAFVVDDDKLTRMLMSRMLTRFGHSVITAENGKMAFDTLRAMHERRPGSEMFDIVFLDNQMPLMSGVEVARELRKLGCEIFIVGCTGNALREDQDEYLAAGADGILPKPIHQKSVLEMIQQARKRIGR